MIAKDKSTSQILEAVHDTASGLHAAGFIDTRRMREYDALLLESNPDFSNEDSGLTQVDSCKSFEVGHE